jgi:hypothetical protein
MSLALTATLQVVALAGFWIDVHHVGWAPFPRGLRLTIEPVLAFMSFALLVQNAIENLAHALAHRLVDTTRWIK